MNRRGLTLIECVVAMAAAALLVVLTLPAIQYAREAARRVQCRNNLHQIGLALHAYHDQFASYPPVYDADATRGIPWRFKRYSGQAKLLPFLGQAIVFNSINFDDAADSEAGVNSTAAATQVATFLCPSDPRRFPEPPADNNYRMNMGTIAEIVRDASGETGPFSAIHHRRSADAIDGLSNTAAFSEKLRGDGMKAVITSETDVFLVFYGRPLLASNAEFVRTCGGLSEPLPEHDSQHGANWIVADSLYTWYNHVTGPNSAIADCARVGYRPYRGLFPARSWHIGGVNVLMADGSVVFVSETIDLTVWSSLGTRAGGEQLGDF